MKPTEAHEKKELFISYKHEDAVKKFVERLRGDLQKRGISLWQDIEDIFVSDDWREEISVGIRNSKAILCILTPKYVESNYCRKEVRTRAFVCMCVCVCVCVLQKP